MKATAGFMLVAGLTALFACARVATEPTAGRPQFTAAAGDTVALRIGEAVRVTGTDVVIGFTTVVSDSRCPIDALCVWEGDAHVQLRLSRGRLDSTKAGLHTGVEPRAVVWDDLRIRLLWIEPARVSDRPVRAEEYVARLEISRRSAP
jgi:hypothetical protein